MDDLNLSSEHQLQQERDRLVRSGVADLLSQAQHQSRLQHDHDQDLQLQQRELEMEQIQSGSMGHYESGMDIGESSMMGGGGGIQGGRGLEGSEMQHYSQEDQIKPKKPRQPLVLLGPDGTPDSERMDKIRAQGRERQRRKRERDKVKRDSTGELVSIISSFLSLLSEFWY